MYDIVLCTALFLAHTCNLYHHYIRSIDEHSSTYESCIVFGKHIVEGTSGPLFIVIEITFGNGSKTLLLLRNYLHLSRCISTIIKLIQSLKAVLTITGDNYVKVVMHTFMLLEKAKAKTIT